MNYSDHGYSVWCECPICGERLDGVFYPNDDDADVEDGCECGVSSFVKTEEYDAEVTMRLRQRFYDR